MCALNCCTKYSTEESCNLASCLPHNDHCSDFVYWRRAGGNEQWWLCNELVNEVLVRSVTCCRAVEGHYEWLRSPDEYLDNEMMLVDLDPGTTYQVRVVAKNGHGYEAAASWLTFHTPGVGQSLDSSRVIFMKHITKTNIIIVRLLLYHAQPTFLPWRFGLCQRPLLVLGCVWSNSLIISIKHDSVT